MSPLFGLFLSTVLYAVLLSSRIGKRFTAEQTWATVAVGCLIVLGWLYIENPGAAQEAAVFFVVGGAPIVARSLWEQFLRLEAYYRAQSREE